MEIAVPDYKTGAIKWEKIASIKQLEPQHVYDLSIEGTRNFIANDIVAHNTYLATDSGKVGIGTTAPATTLDVKGKANFTGNFSIMNASDTLFFVDNTSGRVGIGTTSPGSHLDVIGTFNAAPPLAVGGTITYSGGYIIHTFRGNETFTAFKNINAEVLIVGGGGGGGQDGGRGGGGGAAGQTSGSGGQGGASIYLEASALALTGTIFARGVPGGNSTRPADAGGGGGLLKPGGAITETEPPVDILELISKYAFGDVEKKQSKGNK